MSPLIRRLQKTFPELPLAQGRQNPLSYTFSDRIEKLEPDFYKKIIPLHLVLNLEYSLLCQQIRSKFLSERRLNKDEIEELLIAALIVAELLELIYQNYLVVPREVTRLRRQQILYRRLLAEIIVPLPPHLKHMSLDYKVVPGAIKKIDDTPSFSQTIRTTTRSFNFYRVLFNRSKRTLDLIAVLNTGSVAYCNFVKVLDQYTAPVLTYLAWGVYLPRLFVNFFLILKHTLPHPWMSKEERSLGWDVRLYSQMQRHWFELGNDTIWVTIALINRFILTGALAPVGAYLSIAGFGVDVLMSLLRAFLELKRLYELQKHYITMQSQTVDHNEHMEIDTQLKTIENQISFEEMRLGSHRKMTAITFLAMCCSAPILAANPIIPLISSIVLVSISLINFILEKIINERRPKETIEPSSCIQKFGFFAQKNQPVMSPRSKRAEENEVQGDTEYRAGVCT